MVSSLLGVIACMGDVYNIRGEVFRKGIGFKIGGGSSACLWVDDWLRVGILCSLSLVCSWWCPI